MKVDALILGAGPAGLASAITLASEGLSVAMFEGGRLGGQASASAAIENFPGFEHGIRGDLLTRRMAKQAYRFGVSLVRENLEGVAKDTNNLFHADGVVADVVIAATGMVYRPLGIPGQHLKGVLTGARQVDAKHAIGKTVLIVGGGNSAGQTVIHYAKVARTVMLCVRRPLSDTMSSYLINRLPNLANLSILEGISLVALDGGSKVESAIFSDGTIVDVDLVVAHIGGQPNSGCPVVARDPAGFVLTGLGAFEPNETTIPGIFAVGDVRSGSVKRVATAVGDGASIMGQVSRYLSRAR